MTPMGVGARAAIVLADSANTVTAAARMPMCDRRVPDGGDETTCYLRKPVDPSMSSQVERVHDQTPPVTHPA